MGYENFAAPITSSIFTVFFHLDKELLATKGSAVGWSLAPSVAWAGTLAWAFVSLDASVWAVLVLTLVDVAAFFDNRGDGAVGWSLAPAVAWAGTVTRAFTAWVALVWTSVVLPLVDGAFTGGGKVDEAVLVDLICTLLICGSDGDHKARGWELHYVF